MGLSESLTREEVGALIAIQEKIACHLALIADRERANGESLEKVLSELSNGLPKKIHEPLMSQAEKNGAKLESLMKDQLELKWVARAIGSAIGFIGLGKLALAFGILKP